MVSTGSGTQARLVIYRPADRIHGRQVTEIKIGPINFYYEGVLSSVYTNRLIKERVILNSE